MMNRTLPTGPAEVDVGFDKRFSRYREIAREAPGRMRGDDIPGLGPGRTASKQARVGRQAATPPNRDRGRGIREALAAPESGRGTGKTGNTACGFASPIAERV